MFRALRTERGQITFALASVGGFGIALILIIAVLRLQQPTVITITPTLSGQPERCLTCHNGVEQISPSHTTAQFGCVSCHSGNRLAVDEVTAHTGLVINPADSDHAQLYCGSCHAAQVLMVDRSIMTTYAGAITLIRRAYGLQQSDQAEYAARTVAELKQFSPSPTDPQPVHDFSSNCQSCHTSVNSQHVDYFYRSTGCATCHVLYANDGLYQGGDPTISKTEPGHPQTHTFTTSIPYTQCDHCHNRGNYDLRTMTFVPRPDIPADPTLTGDALRLHDYYQPIGQFTRCEFELDCIDCHTQQEIMGDGVLYNNRTDAQYVQCKTCHGTLNAPPNERTITYADDMAMTLANLNALVDLSIGDTIITTDRGEPFYNIRRVGDQWVLTGKATGQTYTVPLVQGSKCQQDSNNQSSASCHQCHSVARKATP